MEKITNYTTRKELIEALQTQLSENTTQIEKGILRIYEYQTAAEQKVKSTTHTNFVGFRTCDARILSDFAQQLLRGRRLSEKQLSVAKRIMPVYARQLVKHSLASGKIRKDGKYYVFVA